MAESYDIIVLGAGIGGLTCGAFLARAGMRVLVLEKHTKIGGYAHNFRRRQFTFESGIHSVPMAEGGIVRHLLQLLKIDAMVETSELPEMFHATTPGISLTVPAAREEVNEFLHRNFPNQRENLARLITDVNSFHDAIMEPLHHFEEHFVGEDSVFLSRYHNHTYRDYLKGMISDPRLRQIFYCQWPYIGASPDYSANVFSFMMFVMHYLEGSHLCTRGFSQLADALASVIEQHGGAVRTRSHVVRVDARDKRVSSVVTEAGDEFGARFFVSNISPYALHSTLLPPEARGRRWTRRLSGLRPSVSSVAVYLGMKPEVVELMHNATFFWYGTEDHAEIFGKLLANNKNTIDHLVFLRSLDRDAPTLTLMNFVRKSFSTNWRDEKRRIAERMMAKAEELYPGLRDLIVVQEIGSPATFERFTGNTDGALYGFENTRNIYGEAKLPVNTHLENLYQAGHWGKPGCGVLNVMTNGYTVSKIVLRNF